jgi:endonuclease-3
VTKTERANFVYKKLNHLYPDPAVPLDHTDAYTLLIAVLLSAQCTDVRVNLITPGLFSKARTPGEMIKLSIEEIREIIKPCGLSPQKSKAIWNLSQILLAKHQAKVPADIDALEELPGVGHKTAQVVMAQAFKVPSFPVDTHIHRLAFRWGLSNGKNVEQTERDLKEIFPRESWNKLHLQIIYYGREHCSARGCDGTKCEICRTLYPLRKNAMRSTRKPANGAHKLNAQKPTKRAAAAKKSSSKIAKKRTN